MQKKEAVFYLFVWFLGLVFTLFIGKWMNLMGSCLLSLDFLAIMTVYLFSIYGQGAAGAFALGQGFVIDLFSGGLYGLFSVLYLCVFAGIYLGSRIFDLGNQKGLMLLICLVVLIKKVMFIFLVSVFSLRSVPMSFLITAGASIIVSGLVAPLLIYLLNLVRATVFRVTIDREVKSHRLKSMA